MKFLTKLLITLLMACLNIHLVSSVHNPMMRINCLLGEELTCNFWFLTCWRYRCVCLPDHVFVGLGKGCLHKQFA